MAGLTHEVFVEAPGELHPVFAEYGTARGNYLQIAFHGHAMQEAGSLPDLYEGTSDLSIATAYARNRYVNSLEGICRKAESIEPLVGVADAVGLGGISVALYNTQVIELAQRAKGKVSAPHPIVRGAAFTTALGLRLATSKYGYDVPFEHDQLPQLAFYFILGKVAGSTAVGLKQDLDKRGTPLVTLPEAVTFPPDVPSEQLQQEMHDFLVKFEAVARQLELQKKEFANRRKGSSIAGWLSFFAPL